MTDTTSAPRRVALATKIGFALWGVAVLWWFSYYASWGGPFSMLGLKVFCLNGTTNECAYFQRGYRGAIPTYSPIFWYAGMVSLIVGVFQSRRR
jgi:hypothetical protein